MIYLNLIHTSNNNFHIFHSTKRFTILITNRYKFNFHRNDSITTEMEQLLQKIVTLIPADIDPSSRSGELEKFIRGETELPQPLDILPYRIHSIYYLLADHYFKNQDFSKAVQYYILDLSNFPTRFDAWVGLALSKASIMENQLNNCTTVPTKEWIQQSEEVLRCFEQCLKINGNGTVNNFKLIK